MTKIVPCELEKEDSTKAPTYAYLDMIEESRKSSRSFSVFSEESFRERTPSIVPTRNLKIVKRSKRSQIITLIVFFVIGMTYVTLPWVVLRKAFGLELLCFDQEDPDSSDIECQSNSLWLKQSTFSLLRAFSGSLWYVHLIFLCGDPSGSSYTKGMKCYSLILLVALASCYGPNLLQFPMTAIPGVLGGIIGTITATRPNKGGSYLFIFLSIQYLCTTTILQTMGQFLNNPFILGFDYTILIPFYVQLNQGLAVVVCDKISTALTISEFNRDHIVLIMKYQMAFLSSLKLAGLLPIFIRGNFYGTLFVYILLDALGRNQVWRIAYRHAIARLTRKPVSKRKLGTAAQIVLSSELDMDYLPLVLLFAINACQSPLAPTLFTTFHISDTHMTLREDSMLSQSFGNLSVLTFATIFGDLATYWLSKALHKSRVYDIEYVFCQSSKWAGLHGIAIFFYSMNSFLGMVYLLSI